MNWQKLMYYEFILVFGIFVGSTSRNIILDIFIVPLVFGFSFWAGSRKNKKVEE